MTTQGAIAATFCSTVVDEWVKAGVRHAMVAPGSRSTPLALALLKEPGISVQVFHDERSAGFAALGVGLSTKTPAVVLCSSGTAGAHFYASIIEAHLSCVPMIVCTADRPASLRDIFSPQTIDQTKMFGDAVRWFHDPGVPQLAFKNSWRSLAAQVFARTLGSRPGPVHLNLPFDEPLFGEATDLPAPRETMWSQQNVANGFSENDVESFVKLCSSSKGIFVAGKSTPASLLNLAEKLCWPIFADPRSGLRVDHQNSIIAFDPVLRAKEFVDKMTPELVIFVGEPPASKVLSQWVRQINCRTIHLGQFETLVDPLHMVNNFFVGDLDQLCTDASRRVENRDSQWVELWKQADISAQSLIEQWTNDHWSEITVARTVSKKLNLDTHCVVSSSMPIRDFEWFGGVTGQAQVHSNRGANGIDGVVSTAVGVSIGSGKTTFLLIGDIACIHDSNGLWALGKRNVDLRIVVTNNDGGAIFSFLPQAQIVKSEDFESVYGTPHGVSFEALCSAHSISYCRVSSIEELNQACERPGPILIEAFFDRSIDVAQHEELNNQVVEAVKASMA